jgi:hypothetical protein
MRSRQAPGVNTAEALTAPPAAPESAPGPAGLGAGAPIRKPSWDRAAKLLWQLPGEAIAEPDAEGKNALIQQLQSSAIRWQTSAPWQASASDVQVRWYDRAGELVGRLGLGLRDGTGRLWWCELGNNPFGGNNESCQVAVVPEAVLQQLLQTLGLPPAKPTR